MKLKRYEYPKLVSEMDSWLSDPFFGTGELSRLFGGFGDRLGDLVNESRLGTDLYEDDDNYYARFEVPGFAKDEVKVSVDSGVLSVSCEHKEEGERRRQSSSLSRAIRLPDGVNAEKISAKLEDGILTVTLAKAEERKPRSIEIG